MKLGFHYHIPAVAKDGEILTSSFLGLFLDSLAEKTDELVCFMHTPLVAEEFMMDYTIQSKNVRLVSMGPHTSVPRRLLKSGSIVKDVKAELNRLDILLIRCPTPLLPALASVEIKKAFLIVGDYSKSAKDLIQPFFRKKAIQIWAWVNKWQQDRAIQNALVFVNNGLIYNELVDQVGNLHQIKTTTLKPSDFFSREDTCQSDSINILYTGRMDLSKGLLEMIECLNLLRQSGINAFLHFVGWEDKNATIVSDILRQRTSKLKLLEYVVFHGKKKVGTELNSFYRMADIYVIGSKENEGFPRTIWEAMANSCPVVASRIGSIPLFIENDKHAILIEPGSIQSMTNEVLRLLEQPLLRKRLIKNGYEIAQSNTLEKQSHKIITILHEYTRN